MNSNQNSRSMSVLNFNRIESKMSQTFFSQLFGRKFKKVKSGTNSRANTTSFNNVCVIMKSEQNFSNMTSMTRCYHSQTSVTPAVTFINRGEGLVSMQLMERIMINDNELYSMGLSDYSLDQNYLSNSKSFKTSSNVTDLVSECCPPLDDQQWFYGSLERQKAMKILERRPIGSFIIRSSKTHQNCLAMTLRVPNDYNFIGIAHYLIQNTPNNGFKIKGFVKEFKSLESLIIHHSILKELLPCPLLLPNNQIIGRNTKELTTFPLKTKNQEIEDILVDIDSDPNYHKVLIDIRKTMFALN